MNSMRSLLILIIFLSGCTSNFMGYGKWANDIPAHTDENFTNGFEIGAVIPKENLNEETIAVIGLLPQFRLSRNEAGELTAGKFAVNNEMYTPSDLRTDQIVENENPYGGVTSFMLTRINENDATRLSTTLEVGVSGEWSGTEQLQRFVHRDLGFGADPQGWDNQIGAEPIVNLNHERLYENIRKNVWKLQFVTETGAVVRLGNKATDAVLYENFKIGLNTPKLNNPNEELSVYIFTSPFIKGTAHNIFYDGAVFADNPHTVNSKPFVYGTDSGIAVEKGNYSVKFQYRIRTRDYEEQESGFHKYGLLSFGVRW